MTADEALKSGIKKYLVFRGRASTSEFWWVISFIWICVGAAALTDFWVFATKVQEDLSGLAPRATPLDALDTFVGVLGAFTPNLLPYPLILLTIPAASVAARRLHDTGRSGWRQIPILAPLFFGIFSTGFGYLMQKFGIFEGNTFLLPAFLALLGGAALAFASFDRVGDAVRNMYGAVPK